VDPSTAGGVWAARNRRNMQAEDTKCSCRTLSIGGSPSNESGCSSPPAQATHMSRKRV